MICMYYDEKGNPPAYALPIQKEIVGKWSSHSTFDRVSRGHLFFFFFHRRNDEFPWRTGRRSGPHELARYVRIFSRATKNKTKTKTEFADNASDWAHFGPIHGRMMFPFTRTHIPFVKLEDALSLFFLA